MYTVTLQSLKDTIKVAKHFNKPENFTTSIRNNERDISIIVTYYPDHNPKEDIYPYWLIEMREEELCKKEYLGAKELRKVRDIYASFVNQGNESFLESYIYHS